MNRYLPLCVIVLTLWGATLLEAATIAHWQFDNGVPPAAATTLPTSTNSPALDGVATPAGALFSTSIPAPLISGRSNFASLQFPGSAGVQVAYASDNTLLQANQFTIEAFLRTSASAAGFPAIVEKVRAASGDTWSLGLSGSGQIFSRFDTTGGANQTFAGGSALTDNFWHHVAMTYDGSTGAARLYVDYKQVASRTIAGSLQHQYGLDIAGGSGGHTPLTGYVDEVRMTDAVLTPDQFLSAQRAPDRVYENSTRRMAAGDFFGDGRKDTVYLDASGSLVLQTSEQGGFGGMVLLPGTTARAVTAADLDGDGLAEVAFVNAATNQLQSYNAVTAAVTNWSPPGGVSGWNTLSAADVDGDGDDDLMLAATGSNALHVLRDGTYVNTGGAGLRLGNGELVANGAAEEFILRGTTSALYRYNYPANNFTNIGGGLEEIVAGNTFPSDALDEVMVNNPTTKQLYLYNNGGSGAYSQVATQTGTNIAAGSLDPSLLGQELWYLLNGGVIYQSRWNWAEGGPSSGWLFDPLAVNAKDYAGPSALGNSGWADFLLADIDNDGLDELIARKADPLWNNYVFLFENGASSFTQLMVVPEPSAVVLLLLGLAMLASVGRRRRIG